MARAFDTEYPSVDSKTRRKLEDQRRMAFRRASEDYAEQRRLQRELGGYGELVVCSGSRVA